MVNIIKSQGKKLEAMKGDQKLGGYYIHLHIYFTSKTNPFH
jgi:hypothetical protein